MKLLMVTSSYPKFPGDATSPFIESIAEALLRRGHSIDVVLPEHPQLRRSDTQRLRFHPYRYAPSESLALWGYAASLESDVRVKKAVYALAPLAAFSLRRELSARISDERYDAVHVHWLLPNGALVSDIVRRHRVPLVISLHGSDVFLAERRLALRLLARSALRAAGAVTACSEDLRRRVILLGAADARTRTVPYGVDGEAFSPEVSEAGIRARLGVPDGSVLILAIGRLVEKKGFRHLIDAAAGVAGAHVVIAGDGDLRAELAARAHARGAAVTFCGALDRDSVRAALAAADIVAVPSVVDSAGNVDGLPNTLLEALAAARAVVASRVAGIPDVVTHGVNGLLVAPGDPRALAAALAELAASAELRRRLGSEARRLALSRLSWDDGARSFEECYADAAALDAA
jgi:glycosyltransferase involved in cell wall biosynthesis